MGKIQQIAFALCGDYKVPDAAEEMKKQGFPKGPPDSPEFGICDGEEILIKITGNLLIDSDIKTKRLKFYLNMDSACAALKLDVYNKKAQSGDKAFSGELEYNVGPLQDQGPPRRGSIILHIPKDEELLRFAPLTLDIPVKVSAKYLAWRLPSKGKPTLDEFFLSLVDKTAPNADPEAAGDKGGDFGHPQRNMRAVYQELGKSETKK
uniref:Uncharacterized protein LOC111132711 n=1 Tax=Crassostrea virginica TaxID=6565 RepID=A0A8B8E7Z0_CRAVI|nr:uncharacterized protein LOC111132711 [Crassostrea virginica]